MSESPAALTAAPEALDHAAADFGGLVSDRPRAVLLAESVADVRAVVEFAARQRISVVARGRRHSAYGQSQVRDGIVVDLSRLGRVHEITDDHVTVDAGATWGETLRATLERGRTPRVLTDYLGTSIGGTLSAGGIGGTSHRYGVQTDNVLALDIVTGDGVLRTCSPTEAPDLFHAALAGFGRCGIIVRATVALTAAPVLVRRHKVYYPTLAELLTRQRDLLRAGRFDFLQGQILPTEDGWTYLLDAAEYDPSGNGDGDANADTHHDTATIEDLPYWDFADRLADAEAFLRQTGDWFAPHPWPNLLLPGEAVDEFLAAIMARLSHEDLGAPGIGLVYPVPRHRLATPLFRVPDAEIVFLFAGLRYAPAGDLAAVERMLSANRDWYDRAVAVGGTAYPVGAIPFDAADWARHLGPARANLDAARRRYDPHGVFRPGLER